MKKVLFATTALVASTGFASAQGVTLSGSAEMGVVGGDRYFDSRLQFHHDIDVKFTLSGETDNGLTFGATIDLDEIDAAGNGIPPGRNPASVFLSGNFGTITMGDTDGAFDWALQDLDIIADINDSNTSHAGFNGNGGLDGFYDGQVARYDYSFGDFAFAASVELDDFGFPAGDPVFAVGGKYSGELGGVTLGVGLGYQSNSAIDLIGVSLDAEISGVRGVVNYTDYSGATLLDSHVGVGLFYSMDAISVGANYGMYTFGGGAEFTGYGVAANYDLGGGAVVQAGYGYSDFNGVFTSDSFSLGVAMSF